MFIGLGRTFDTVQQVGRHMLPVPTNCSCSACCQMNRQADFRRCTYVAVCRVKDVDACREKETTVRESCNGELG